MRTISTLLAERDRLLRQARLANLAFGYKTLCEFAARVARAGLRGRVTLEPIDPDANRYCVGLTALDASQSVIEEHFSDEDLALLADVIGFATGHPGHELTFHLEQLAEFIAPLQTDLEKAGVIIDTQTATAPQSDA